MAEHGTGGEAAYPTIVHALVDAAVRRPDATALICGEVRLTYAQYAAGTAKIAADLKARGIGKGDRVAVAAPTSVMVPVATLGVMAAGAQPAMMNPNYRPREMAPLFAIAEPKAAFVGGDAAETIKSVETAKGVDVLPLPAVADIPAVGDMPALHPAAGPEDPGLMLYTGGTTGISKGVSHSHAAVLASLGAIERRWPTERDKDVFLDVPPLFHIIGAIHGMLQPLYQRTTAVFLPRFHPDQCFDALAQHKVTIFFLGIPTAYVALMNHPRFKDFDFSHVKFAVSGGAPMPEETLKAWERATKVPVLEGYGMTEGAPTCVNPLHGTRKPLSVGLPMDNAEFQIVDVETGTTEMGAGEPGEVRVRAPHVAHAYVNNPEATKAAFRDGWLYTGDIAYRDEDGYVFMVDRSKDMAIVSGFNVFPREIDEVLAAHPKVKEAAAVGVPDSYRGEIIKAFVVPRDGATLTEDELKAYCAENLVTYKIPAQFAFIEELPKTPVGKIDKKQLRA